MNDLTKKAIQNFSNSAQWEIIKDGYFIPLLQEIENVRKPLKIGDQVIDAEHAYYAKGLTATKLQEIIDTIDRAKPSLNQTSSEDFE